MRGDQISLWAERIELPAPDLHDVATLLALWTADAELAVSDACPLP